MSNATSTAVNSFGFFSDQGASSSLESYGISTSAWGKTVFPEVGSSAFSEKALGILDGFLIGETDKLQIEELLAEKPDVLRALEGTRIALRSFFGVTALFELQIIPDYEDGDEPTLIVMIITGNASIEDDYSVFTKFEDDWWYHNCEKARDVFDVSLV